MSELCYKCFQSGHCRYRPTNT